MLLRERPTLRALLGEALCETNIGRRNSSREINRILKKKSWANAQQVLFLLVCSSGSGLLLFLTGLGHAIRDIL
jgi:hypothetical protein